MKSLNPSFSFPCFSGQCQFCSSCCDSEKLSDDSESIQRANTLIKFIMKIKFSLSEASTRHVNWF